MWHHAAVYVGRSRICEATPRHGVVLESIYKYVPSHRIRARRCPILKDDLAASYDVAIAALARLHRPYSFATALSLWWMSLSSFLEMDFARAQSRAQICSNLYFDSYSQAMDRGLKIVGTPTPAALSATPALENVDSRWRRLAQ